VSARLEFACRFWIHQLTTRRNEACAGELQEMRQKHAEACSSLKESQQRGDAMAAAAEQLYGKHITVCR